MGIDCPLPFRWFVHRDSSQKDKYSMWDSSTVGSRVVRRVGDSSPRLHVTLRKHRGNWKFTQAGELLQSSTAFLKVLLYLRYDTIRKKSLTWT